MNNQIAQILEARLTKTLQDINLKAIEKKKRKAKYEIKKSITNNRERARFLKKTIDLKDRIRGKKLI